MKFLLALTCIVFRLSVVKNDQFMTFKPCGSEDIEVWFENGRSPGDDNQFIVDINLPKNPELNLNPKSNMTVTFESEAKVIMFGCPGRVIKLNGTNTIIELDNNLNGPLSTTFTVRGKSGGEVPYITSIKMYDQEQCKEALMGYLDRYVQDYKVENCGRRGMRYVELMYNGEPTVPGDWPWHAAVYIREETEHIYMYQCGGTLISKSLVLTAAHCVVGDKSLLGPNIFRVVLGKYNLTEGDSSSQQKEISSIHVHEYFRQPDRDDNDVSLLKLKTEAVFNDYVQPVCIWNSQARSRLPSDNIYGSVVGWGLDETNTLSQQLKHATLPLIPYAQCVKRKPIFYANLLKDENKFCAGWLNGTMPCKGDSGGGFTIFVPDQADDDDPQALGRWYIMGLVSLAIPKDKTMCDPEYYVVFTNVSRYQDWIMEYKERFT